MWVVLTIACTGSQPSASRKVELEIWPEFLALNALVVESNMRVHLVLGLKHLILGWGSRRK